ncbi:diaminopimelate epimerase [Spirillospora sp. CA-294931]|uniref:diaminopimelate epimerase n=1 Tax=Spirillospora sp. CA-294931 TaxID=3240042 RepID=UPI003D920923
MRFIKGHGTENDFVILPDPDGALDLAPETVARLCDRRAGIGADGVLRVVRTKALDAATLAALMAESAPANGSSSAEAPQSAPSPGATSPGDPSLGGASSGGTSPGGGLLGNSPVGEAEWFMDYRNADGSVAEMCGNGVRVFARYLVDAGLAAPGEWDLATRAGLRRVTLGASGDVSVDMGPAQYLGTGEARLAGRSFDGKRVSMGNPHLACPVAEPVRGLDLTRAPEFDPQVYPDGVNVEFFRTVGDHHVEMRVFERGSGETRSCGTGTVAVAVAAALGSSAQGAPPRGEWTVDVPGGRVTVTLDGRTSHLKGPAVLVAEGDLRDDWLLA